jgi:hypothetical protein
MPTEFSSTVRSEDRTGADSRAFGEITATASGPQLGAARIHGETPLSPNLAGVEADTSQTRCVSASPLHAVRETANPSAAPWHHRDTVVLSPSDADTLGAMNDETDLVTPLAQAPRTLQSQPETPKVATWRDDNSQSAISERHARVENNFPHSTHKLYELPAPDSAMGPPAKAGTSILSQISAMVSDEASAPYSQNSTGRSTSSAIHRIQPRLSTGCPKDPAQIPDQSPTSRGNRTPDGEGNDLDLYADYNGIVKGLRDEMGQPLRLAESRKPSPEPQHQQIESETADVETVRESQNDEQPRYSTERPMSFIAGPADQDGKPQDQINQSATPDNVRMRRARRQRENHVEQHYAPPGGTVYSELPADSLDPPWNPVQSTVTSSASPPGNPLRAVKSLDPTRPAKHAYIDPTHFSGQMHSQQPSPGTQSAHGQLPQNSHISNLALHQPQAKRVLPVLQITPGLPREQSPNHASQYQDSGQELKSQQELRQQEQQQTDHVPFQGIENRHSISSAQSSVYEVPKPHEKSSSKGKVSSIFKKFGGNGQTTSQQQSSAEKSGHLKSSASVKRPSVDQQSQTSQKSFFDLRKQRNPAAFYSIPYQQSTRDVQEYSDQRSQTDTAGAGKSKRFSGLGAIFGKDGSTVDGMATKFKFSSSKEDKKGLKSQGHSAQTQIRREWDSVKQLYKPLQDQQSQQTQSPTPSIGDTRPEEGSAFLQTKQIAQEYQAQQDGQQSPQSSKYSVHTGSLTQNHPALVDRMGQTLPESPLGEYYRPGVEQAGDDQGAYAATVAARQQYEQLQAQRQTQAVYGQSNHRDLRHEQQQQQPSHPLSGQAAHVPWPRQHSMREPDHGKSSWNAASSEPKYEATPIPAAYSHVSGAYVASLEQQEQPVYPPRHVQTTQALPNHVIPQFSDPWMPVISPQVSAQSQMYPGSQPHSQGSTMHVVSPISHSASMYNSPHYHGFQQTHRPRIASVSDVHQQDRPWHLNLPAGATEQEIVRARQGQYMQALFNAQQQQQAERAAGSPSPHTPQHTTPTSAAPREYAPGGGFRELLPTNSSQPYPAPHSGSPLYEQSLPTRRHPAYEQQVPARSGPSPQPAAYPLSASSNPTNITSPVNPLTNISHSPTRTAVPNMQMYENDRQHQQRHDPSPTENVYQTPLGRAPQYDVQIPDEAPPSYDGIGVPNEGMHKTRPDAVRPPNINTNVGVEHPSQRPGSRPRQPSIGMLQHPQPASMAASPQRTLSDMGAESLRRQLLQQENLQQMERVQRERERREALARERQQREAARARARELERSVSVGGQVGSLRSIGGSFNGGVGSWERSGSHHRQVFELPALEDDEPVMKATSYPGQEWTPPVWDGE